MCVDLVGAYHYVNSGNDLLKPSQLVEGLRAFGGIPRSSAHRLTFNVQQCSVEDDEADDADLFDSEHPNSTLNSNKGRPSSSLGEFL